MGDDGHEVVTHAHRLLQLAAGDLQLLQQDLLLSTTLFEGHDLLLHGLSLAIQLDEHIDLALDGLGVQRLVQEVHRAVFITGEGIVALTTGGADENDRDAAGLLRAPHQLGQPETVHLGHLHIDDGQGKVVLQQQGQCFVRRQGLEDLAVVPLINASRANRFSGRSSTISSLA